MDDKRPNQPLDSEPSPDDEQAEEERQPPNRFDRLMSAKDKADKEAARWSEIEDIGLPVPSHDQDDPGTTQLVETEPPVEKDDTPTGKQTPPQGVPQADQQIKQEPPPELPSRRRLPPDFPHPTDQPFESPPSPQAPGQSPAGEAVSHPADEGLLSEPPPPTLEDIGAGDQGIISHDEQPHRRYGLPPEKLNGVRVDSDGMPLPRRVPRDDPNATMVGWSALHDNLVEPPAHRTQPHIARPPQVPQSEETQPSASVQRPAYPPVAQPIPPAYEQAVQPPSARAPSRRPRAQARRRGFRFTWGCLARVLVLGFIAGLVALMLGGGGAAIYYAQVTAPSFEGIDAISDLQDRALQFETTRIRDREGNILYQINDPEGGLRDYVTLDEVSPWVIHATIATEEREYFTNPGFSIPAIVRAVIQNYREGQVISGASTITQQLTRALLLPEEERAERSYRRKVKEIFLAAELGRRFSKEEILELYLNQIYYGNLAYGIEAASQTYFDKSARDLTAAEASFLAGLPQSPVMWDPVTNKEASLQRQQQQVLPLMLEAGCLDTGKTGLALPCFTEAELLAMQAELAAIAAREFHAPNIQAKYPHWVVYVQQLLEADDTIGPAIYTSGFDVYTTIDPHLQDLAQEMVELSLSGLTDRNVTNASVVVIDVDTGAILAMVGSRDFDDESIDGQVNVALTPQQPGSSIKPFTYLAAFRQGWTPATVIWDVPIRYEIPGFGTYEPVDYDGKFRGAVTVREAIANSLNIPAVLTLDHVGVPALLEVLNDVGISSLGDPSNPYGYGLSLTLGAGDVYLLEWTNAFATIGNGGVYRPVYAIERIERNGQILEGYPYQVPPGEQVIDAQHAYLLQSIMSDGEARIPAFGANSVLTTPYPAGAKTGTTNDFRDNWTMGYTTEIAVGVWVGNTDNSPMLNVSGVTGAGPIWRGIMDGSQQWYPAQPFPRPAGVFEQTVCKDDGVVPSQYCLDHSRTYNEIFASFQHPPEADQSMYRQLQVDTFTGLIANAHCPDFVEEKFYIMLPDLSQLIDVRPFIRDWLANTDPGRAWITERGISPDWLQDEPPEEACGPETPKPRLAINSPEPGSEQSGVMIIYGTADAPNFSHYIIEYGLGPDPQGWGLAQGATPQPVQEGVLGQLDLAPAQNGLMTIRLIVYDTAGHSAEVRVTFMVANPTPTPTPTPTEEPPDTPTPTLPATAAPTPSATPTE